MLCFIKAPRSKMLVQLNKKGNYSLPLSQNLFLYEEITKPLNPVDCSLELYYKSSCNHYTQVSFFVLHCFPLFFKLYLKFGNGIKEYLKLRVLSSLIIPKQMKFRISSFLLCFPQLCVLSSCCCQY